MGQWSRIWLCCISDGVPKRSLVVALVVGTILNLINQGDALVAGARLNLTKLILTFCRALRGRNLWCGIVSAASESRSQGRRPTLTDCPAITGSALRLRGRTPSVPR